MRSIVIGFIFFLSLLPVWNSLIQWNVSTKQLNAKNSVSMEIEQTSKVDNLVLDSESQRNRFFPYTMDSIANLVQSLVYIPGLVIIYDPSSDMIHVYSMSNNNSSPVKFCRRCRLMIPALARALWKFPRLSPNHSHVQLFTSEDDFPYVNMDSISSSHDFSPWIQFGSTFQNLTILPNVHAFPFSDFLPCFYELNLHQIHMGANTLAGNESAALTLNQTCSQFSIASWNDSAWDNLIPQIIWRGSNFQFLHTFHQKDFQSPYTVPKVPFFPRQLVIHMSEATNYTWLNAKFRRGLTNSMKIAELSKYKYHIDLGGAGGTTWTGTVSKLAMPGVLFHHETPAKDWFYDSLRPWEHYVPIHTDLSDLKQKYEWAENNPDKVKEISIRATKFVQMLLSYQNLQAMYETCMGKKSILSDIAHAYFEDNPTHPFLHQTLDNILMEYQQKWNLNVSLVSLCSQKQCDVKKNKNAISRVSIHPGKCERHIRGYELFGKKI
jgi:Glycosyl transferase family 90